LAPYTERQLHILDLIRGRVIKKILRLPSTMSTAVLYLPDNKLGFKMESIVPAHAQMAAESLIHSLEDKGKLGTLTRALTVKHLQTRRRAGETPSLMKPRETWLTRMPAAMSLRKAAWVKLTMQVDMPRQAYSLAAGRADLWEIVQDCNRLHNVHADDLPALPSTRWRRSEKGVVAPQPAADSNDVWLQLRSDRQDSHLPSCRVHTV